jgi:hypothetical protein
VDATAPGNRPPHDQADRRRRRHSLAGLTDLFANIFYRRAKAKEHMQADVRAWVYVVCGIAILLSIAALAFNGLSGESRIPRVTFYGEATALVAFDISRLLASHVLPVMNREDERFSPLRDNDPEPAQARAGAGE